MLAIQIFVLPNDQISHRILLMAEWKKLEYEVVQVDMERLEELDEDMKAYNPELSFPALKTKEVILAGQSVLMEYLEERYPYPSIYPLTPIERARARWSLINLQTRVGRLMAILASPSERPKSYQLAKEGVLERLNEFEEYIQNNQTEESMPKIMECVLLPMLWHLQPMGMQLDKTHPALAAYAQEAFKEESFQKTLSHLTLDYSHLQ